MGRGKSKHQVPTCVPISNAPDRYRSTPTLQGEPEDGLPKKKPVEWAEEDCIAIVDDDGWRGANAPPFDEPCTRKEYERRVRSCTVRPLRFRRQAR